MRLLACAGASLLQNRPQLAQAALEVQQQSREGGLLCLTMSKTQVLGPGSSS